MGWWRWARGCVGGGARRCIRSGMAAAKLLMAVRGMEGREDSMHSSRRSLRLGCVFECALVVLVVESAGACALGEDGGAWRSRRPG